jgi:3-oxoacyl-[acyl-carrier protein] reductase
VNCVSPGAVATDFVEGRDRKKLEQQATSAPLQKVVEPEDVAKAIIAYITHLKHSTGARIIVDSGKFLK